MLVGQVSSSALCRSSRPRGCVVSAFFPCRRQLVPKLIPLAVIRAFFNCPAFRRRLHLHHVRRQSRASNRGLCLASTNHTPAVAVGDIEVTVVVFIALRVLH